MKKNSRKNPYKADRVASEIEKIVQEVVTYEIKDPRVAGNATVTEVALTPDLQNCKIYVQVLEEDKKSVMDGLKNATGFVRHAIADSLDMRKTPEVMFVLDESLDRMNRIEELLKQIK